MSLAQLTEWCNQRFGKHPAVSNTTIRPFDVPWVVLDSTRARKTFDWTPEMTLPKILDEIAAHTETHPDWLNMTVA